MLLELAEDVAVAEQVVLLCGVRGRYSHRPRALDWNSIFEPPNSGSSTRSPTFTAVATYAPVCVIA